MDDIGLYLHFAPVGSKYSYDQDWSQSTGQCLRPEPNRTLPRAKQVSCCGARSNPRACAFPRFDRPLPLAFLASSAAGSARTLPTGHLFATAVPSPPSSSPISTKKEKPHPTVWFSFWWTHIGRIRTCYESNTVLCMSFSISNSCDDAFSAK